MERELKLRLSHAAAAALPAHPVLREAEADTSRIVTTYFDTAHDDLAQRGLSLRVRRRGDARIQTLKSQNAGGAAFDRGEWEWPIERDEPDLDLARQAPVGAELPRADALVPVAATDVKRTRREVSFDGARIEVDWDEGRITAGDLQTPLRELELELREGNVSALFKLALSLHQWAPLTIEAQSKAARGYRLKAGLKPEAHKAADVDLRGAGLGEAFARIVRAGLGHALANRDAAEAGDVEGIHQSRVAIRRLRSGLQLFAPCLGSPALDAFQNELRRVGRVFGEARDWDVFRLEILPDALAIGADDAWGRWLAEAADARRAVAHQKAGAELNSREFAALAFALSAWAEDLAEGKALRRPISAAASDLLDALAHKVDKRARGLAEGSPAALHPLRKSLKKLRYGVEFVGSLYPSRRVQPYLDRLEALQKTLGKINDAATAAALAASLASHRIELAVAVGAVESAQEQRRAKAMQKLHQEWRKFEDESRFWV